MTYASHSRLAVMRCFNVRLIVPLTYFSLKVRSHRMCCVTSRCGAPQRNTSHRIRCKQTLRQKLSLQSTVTYVRRRICRWGRSGYDICWHRICRHQRSYTNHSAIHSLSYIHITTLASLNPVKSSEIRRQRLFKNRWVQTCFVWSNSKLYCPQVERFPVTLTENTK